MIWSQRSVRSSSVYCRCWTRVSRPRDARQDPELDEPHRLVGGAVLLRVQVAAVRERHDLGGARLELAVVAERVGVEEVALDDVRQRLDVLVRVERPLGAGDDPVVVEDAQRADAHLFGIPVAVEREVPAGVEPAALFVPDALANYWANEYDWRKVESRLNGLPQFKTQIDGVDIHFIHVKSRHENALPLIITHGWPGSVIEMLDVIGPLTDPTAYGGTETDAFDVVIPSMPGFGSRTSRPSWAGPATGSPRPGQS